MKNRSLLTVNEDFESIFNAEIGQKMGYAKVSNNRRRTQVVRERSAKSLCAGSNPAVASKQNGCRGGGIGRHKGLKIPRTFTSVPVQVRSPVHKT